MHDRSYDLRSSAVRRSLASTPSASEDGDTPSLARRRAGAPDVSNLKDSLLNQVRGERQRALGQDRPDATSAYASSGVPTAPLPTTQGFSANWTAEDERQQAEALRNIQLLRRSGGEVDASANAARVQDLETQLRTERARREAAQQQVLCLEYELDGKEAALQVLEKHLEEREAELRQAQQQLELKSGSPEDAAKLRSMRIELEEKDRQLDLKENQKQQLMNILLQHGSSLSGGDADRLSSTFSSFPTSFR
mmetsp:Transcript_77265/g.185053  ORF Transcript_77265/g.185053 Transcript_77265/m.185053 type:complete len:251 (-) Transcript_77265:28-780(-)